MAMAAESIGERALFLVCYPIATLALDRGSCHPTDAAVRRFTKNESLYKPSRRCDTRREGFGERGKLAHE